MNTDIVSSPVLPPSQPLIRNGFGRTAFVLGLIIVCVGVMQQLVAMMLPMIMQKFALSVSSVSMIFTPFYLLDGILGVLAVTFGIISLQRPGLPRGAAAAGTALGGHVLLNIVVSVVAFVAHHLS